MIINLKELKAEGESYDFSRKTGELNDALFNLIRNEPYEIKAFLLPASSGTFSLTGSIKTKTPELCSRCGLDFKYNINFRFNELLMGQVDQPRNSHFAKVNHVAELNTLGPSIYEVDFPHFNLAEYIHEAIGLSLPINPAPPADKAGDCTGCDLKDVVKPFAIEQPGFEKKESPFAALKTFKCEKLT